MNKQDILEEINKTKEYLANLEEKLKECEYERWKPKTEEVYYWVDAGLKIYAVENFNFPSDINTIKAYNCFETREQAEQEAEKILVRRMLEDIAKRLNKGQKIDWHNIDQNKYFICSNHWQDTIILEHGWKNKFCGVIYCLDENFLDVAKCEIGEERLKKYLRGE